MRISAKGRYALAAMMHMAQQYSSSEAVTVIRISEKLGISKIYLEQVFSLLKRGGLVASVKGAAGGYRLSRQPDSITALDVLSAVELALFETAESAVEAKAPEYDATMQRLVFGPADEALRAALGSVTLADLAIETARLKSGQENMYFI